MKTLIKTIKENYKLVLGVFVLGLLFGWIFFHSSGEATIANKENADAHEGHNNESEDPITWTCSMHPQIKQDKPGQCPICAMDLIPLKSMTSKGDDIDPNEIMMSESAAKLASIQTMLVTKRVPTKAIYLQGKIQTDERNIAELTARFGGRIEKLFVNFTGQKVRKGEKLATIYSPALVTAQRELLEALSFKESRPSLYTAAKGKLRLWDLTDEQISRIEKKGEPQLYFEVLSPISGTVMMRHISLGDYVKEGMPLFKVADLTKVWAVFDAYESDLPWIKLGDQVNFTIQALPGKTFSSKVSFIDPFINGKTRVTKVRLEMSNPNLVLKPEMFTSGILESEIAAASNQIVVPKSAILWTGKRAVIYVKVPNRESPSFKYREVVLGPEAGAFYVISEGLMEGEEIAVNGVFKIDAASQLQGLPSMMNPEGGVVSSGHNHGESNSSSSATEGSMNDLKAPMAFKEQLGAVVEAYLELKDAFTKTDESLSESRAQSVLTSLNKVDMSLLEGEAHNVWMKEMKLIKDNLNGIINMEGIAMKRSHFELVSDHLTLAIKSFGFELKDRKSILYRQFCPMAFNDTGAYWLSDVEEIRNPYFGDMMLKCGEVKELINSK